MGKSGTRKKKPSPDAPPKPELDAAVFLRRAHELKEEGNRLFQSKDYPGAMEQYEQALKLTPRNHPDRAIFHSNCAACLMQMKPAQYDAVIKECSLALEAHPRFGRALFRRARAFEATGKLELALQDVQLMLQGEGNQQDVMEMSKRLRVALGNREEAQQDSQGKPAAPAGASYAGTSPAALGASVVRGSPVGARGPCLPARPLPKKKGIKPEQAFVKVATSDARQNGGSTLSAAAPEQQDPRIIDAARQTLQSHVPGQDSKSVSSNNIESVDRPRGGASAKAKSSLQEKSFKVRSPANLRSRALKLIYDHDIRLAQIHVNCTFTDLRELVRKRYPSSKAVLIKYKDAEGDLVTITNTQELRLAEEAAAIEAAKKKLHSLGSTAPSGEEQSCSMTKVPAVPTILDALRLHVVEVPAEQEPDVPKEDAFIDTNMEEIKQCTEDPVSSEDTETGDIPNVVQGATADSRVSLAGKAEDGQLNGKELEIDEWLLDFAHLFRTHLGIDPDGHVDLHDLGMELCSEALEETVTSEEAQKLFEMAACKFQEVAALAFFNWGNVHMCAARKRIPLDDNGNKSEVLVRLQAAFDWAQQQYSLAEKKYEEALKVKPDFYEGVLALGQEKFESAKLHWSLAIASEVDLSSWNSKETLDLFESAEEEMQVAAGMWEKLQERRMKEAKSSKNNLTKADLQGQGEDCRELTEAEILEQFVVMRSQIDLFWGNVLFEHSQVEFRLGLPSWKYLLDKAVVRFELAGASPKDIGTVLKNHISNSSSSQESSAHGKECQIQENGEVLDSKDIPISAMKTKAHSCDEHNSSEENDLLTKRLENCLV